MEHVIVKSGPEQYLTNQWSGGTTTQVAIGPQGATYTARDFDWRISSAVVADEESIFTSLPAYNRFITTLQGSMDLTVDDEKKQFVGPGIVFPFDGGSKVHSVGSCRDFNLMLRKGKCTGSLTALRLNGTLQISTAFETVVLYCAEGSVALHCGNQKETAAQGETLQLTVAPGEMLHLTASADSFVMLAQVGVL